MIKNLHLTSWVFTLFIAACLLAFTTATPALGDIFDQDSPMNVSVSTDSRKGLRSPPIGSGRRWERPVILTQSISSCPCFSRTTLASTTWDRCDEFSGLDGLTRRYLVLERHVGDPKKNEIWTARINLEIKFCQCLETPSGVCKGNRNSDIYQSDLADTEMRACVDIIQKVADAQGLSCE